MDAIEISANIAVRQNSLSGNELQSLGGGDYPNTVLKGCYDTGTDVEKSCGISTTFSEYASELDAKNFSLVNEWFSRDNLLSILDSQGTARINGTFPADSKLVKIERGPE